MARDQQTRFLIETVSQIDLAHSEFILESLVKYATDAAVASTYICTAMLPLFRGLCPS